MGSRDKSDADDRYNRPGKRRPHHSAEDRHDHKRKKHRDERERERDFEMGEKLSRLDQPDLPTFTLTSNRPSSHDKELEQAEEYKSVERQTVGAQTSEKTKKIPKGGSSNYPSITFDSKSRLQSQIKISDLQALVLYVMADGSSPQWVSVRHRPELRKVVVLMVPGLERSMFEQNDSVLEEIKSKGKEKSYTNPDEYYPIRLDSNSLPSNLKKFAEMFEHLWSVKTPGDDKYNKMHSPLHAMLTVPLSKSQEYRGQSGAKSAREPHGWQNNRTRITEYLSLPEILLENDYTLHPAMYNEESDKLALQEQRKRTGTSIENEWVDTAVKYFAEGYVLEKEIEQGSLTAGREIFAMDCEMCMTGEKEFSLTRISLVSWDGSVILDELVKPDKPITDYVTMYSGITEVMLAPVTTTLRDIQVKLLKILNPRTILLGHSLNSDLTALKLTHPYIVDTALLYPHPRGPPLKSSLKWLAQKYLNREVQKGGVAGHDSIEDARTCLDLVKQKCEKGPQWGTNEAAGESIFKRLARAGVRYKNQGGSSMVAGQAGGKSTAAIDWGDPKRGPAASANVIIGCSSDDEVTKGVIRAVNGDPDGLDVPGGGVDFVWGRLRELEALKGWWNNNRHVSDNSALQVPEKLAVAAQAVFESKVSTAGSKEVNVEVTDGLVGEASKSPAVSQALDQKPSTEPIVKAEADLDPVPSTEQSPTTDPDQPDTPLQTATAAFTARIFSIYESLPPCTAFIVYSGSGDPCEMSRLQAMLQTFKQEYRVKKWDQLSVKWTDVEDQALKKAAKKARNGIGFITVK